MSTEVPPEMQIYVDCMTDIRQRLGFIRWGQATAHSFETEHVLLHELIFMQFRKVLELIAFSSLSANPEKYEAALSNFRVHWKAKAILAEIEKLNPKFYPMPVRAPEIQPDGSKMLQHVPDGFLTRDEFVVLYDLSSEVLHVRNPFAAQGRSVQLPHPVHVLVARIQTLLRLHVVNLVDETRKWVVEIPAAGPVHVLAATGAFLGQSD